MHKEQVIPKDAGKLAMRTITRTDRERRMEALLLDIYKSKAGLSISDEIAQRIEEVLKEKINDL